MASAIYSKKAAHGLAKTVTKDGRYSATYHERRLYPKGDERQTSIYLPTAALQAAAAAVQAPVDATPRPIGPASQRLPRYTKEAAVERRRRALQAQYERQQYKNAAEAAQRLAEAELSYSARPEDITGYRTRTEGQGAASTLSLDHALRETPSDPRPLQQLAAQELEAYLVLHLTIKEVEALKRRADGQAQPDRSARDTLQRAQRKAQAALAAL